jgi:serine/threonine-protein kinase
VTWLAAREYAEKMNKERLAGFSDWRLPTVEELASLMENSWKNGDLFIDPVFNREMRNCWSLDTRGMEAAWKANFHQGFFLDFPMTSNNSARLVRSLQ